MFRVFRLCFGIVARLFRSRRDLLLENLALWQQLTALKRKHPKPRLGPLDKLFWVLVRRFWSAWKLSLIVVTPETVVRWHRAGFRMYWSLISTVKRRIGRKTPPKEAREGHPTSAWIVQQLREAFPYQSAPKFLIFDHDPKYGLEVPAAIRSMKIACLQTSIQSPWQNGVAERWVGSCRRDLLDHVIAMNERHLKRLLSDYISYYHEDRTHLGLEKQTPARRARSAEGGQVISRRRLGGLHQRYDRAA